MNVNVIPKLEKLNQDKVAPGLDNNPREVVREALRLLVDRDRLRESHLSKLRGALAEGLIQADRGEPRDAQKVVADLMHALKKKRPAKKKTG
jgi:antitoxin ParD1/3/4